MRRHVAMRGRRRSMFTPRTPRVSTRCWPVPSIRWLQPSARGAQVFRWASPRARGPWPTRPHVAPPSMGGPSCRAASPAWPMLDLAAARGVAARIGLEDTLRLPEGTTAASNAELVAAGHGRIRTATTREVC